MPIIIRQKINIAGRQINSNTNHQGIEVTALQILSAASATPPKKGSTNSGLCLIKFVVFIILQFAFGCFQLLG